MQRTFQVLPLAECLRPGVVPGHTFPRVSPTESWLVLAAPVDAGGWAEWAQVSESDFIHVPLHRYYTVRDPAAAVAFAASIAALAVRAAAEAAIRAVRMHVIYADTVEEAYAPDGVPALAIYLGLALQVAP